MLIRYFILGLISIAVILNPFQLSSNFILRVIGVNMTQAAVSKLIPPSNMFLEKGKGGVYGRITYNGIPVDNARVIIGSNITALLNSKEDIIRTNADDGYYEFSNLSPGTYCLAAGWPDEESYWFWRQRLGGQAQCVSVEVVAGKWGPHRG